jgi:phage shock protein PspC (stress-responsive transcriptional regulator)
METTQSTQQQPQQTPRPRLERLRSDRIIAGVASGFARHLGIDAAWVRIAFVVLAFFGGAGILAYLIAWIAIPEEGESESVLTTRTRHNPRLGSWVGLGLIALAVMILIGNTGLVDGDIVFAGGLIVVGILLYRGDLGGFGSRPDKGGEPEADVSMPAAPIATDEVSDIPPSLGIDQITYDSPPVAPPVAPPAPPAPAFRPRPPKPRHSSALGRLAIASTLIVVGVMGVGQSLDWWAPFPRHYAGAVLVTLGAALLIGALFGRARWLIAIGLIAAPLLFGAALVNVPMRGGWGDPQYTPVRSAELATEYRLIGGEMILDLSHLSLQPGEIHQVDSSVAFGRLEIRVPDGVGVNVTAQVDAGQILINGASADEGLDVDAGTIYEGTGMINLDAHVGFGELDIHEVEVGP